MDPLQKFKNAVTSGDEAEVRKLLAGASFRTIQANLVLSTAVRNGHEGVVRLLTPLCDARSCGSALSVAAGANREGLVQHLLPFCTHGPDVAMALSSAADKGYDNLVKLLLPHTEPEEPWCDALFNAAERGDEAILNLLVNEKGVQYVFRFGLIQKSWNALDTISSHLSLDMLAEAVTKAPPEELLNMRARLLNHALSEATPETSLPIAIKARARL